MTVARGYEVEWRGSTASDADAVECLLKFDKRSAVSCVNAFHHFGPIETVDTPEVYGENDPFQCLLSLWHS